MEKKPILDIMVDLETASTKENAAILSWAMVPFDRFGKRWGFENFYKTVNLTSCFMAGMDIEKDTQKWWEKQDPEARAAVMKSEGENILSVTNAAYCWLSTLAEKNDLYMWCRGIDFDLPKMEWCFRKFVEKSSGDEGFPYKFSHKMDVRTVLKFMDIDQSQFEFEGIKHHSVDDCNHDIKMIQKACQLKNDWMTAYTICLAKKTSDSIKAKKTNKEAGKEEKDVCNGTDVAFPNLSKLLGVKLETCYELHLIREDFEKLEFRLQAMKESCEMLGKENKELVLRLTGFQSKF